MKIMERRKSFKKLNFNYFCIILFSLISLFCSVQGFLFGSLGGGGGGSGGGGGGGGGTW